MRFPLAACGMVMVLACPVACSDESISRSAPPLTAENYGAWRDYILPTEAELAPLRTIPWHPSFAAGLQAAAAESKPVLLWTMNGHPLGCT